MLTPREREVAACVACGLPNREVAARLWLTTATVKDHVHRILTKTGVHGANKAIDQEIVGFNHIGATVVTSG